MERTDVINFLLNHNWILYDKGILYVPGFYPEVYEECNRSNMPNDILGVYDTS